MQTFHDKDRVHETHYVLQEIGVEGSLADGGNQRTEGEGHLHRDDDGRDGREQPEGRKMEGRCMGKSTFWAVVSILNNFPPPHDYPENIRQCWVIATGGGGGCDWHSRMLLNVLACSGQPPQQGTTQPEYQSC